MQVIPGSLSLHGVASLDLAGRASEVITHYSNYFCGTQMDSGVSRLKCACEPTGRPVKMRLMGPAPLPLRTPTPRASDSGGLGPGPKFCITKMLPSDAGPISRLSSLDLCSSSMAHSLTVAAAAAAMGSL